MRRRQSLLLMSLALLQSALAAGLASAQPAPPGSCQASLERWRKLASISLDDWRVRAGGEIRGDATELDDAAWDQLQPRQEWPATTLWLRTHFQIQSARDGYDLRGARLLFRPRGGGEWPSPLYWTIFVNGAQRYAGYEPDAFALAEAAEPGQTFLIAMRVQTPAGKMRGFGGIVEIQSARGRPDAATILQSCAAAEILNETAGEGKRDRAQILAGASALLAWDALARGEQTRFDAGLEALHEKLASMRDWLKSYTVHAIGNSHIDMAWLWPWTETVEVTRNTFTSALHLMQEFPDFSFSHSSVQTYAWMEDKYPALFEEIRRRVKEGRWEFVGGMWVEPDLNLPDGESLVRQLLVGKRYVKEKFGPDVRVGWNPDSFGYNWQLPQIYKKSGIDYFVTQKLSWNDTNKPPHKLFWWESPDGSRVLSYLPHDYVNSMEPIRMARDLAAYAPATAAPRLMHLYGVGDHGGGPTRRMLEMARKWQAADALFPQIKFDSAGNFFRTLESAVDLSKIPVWKSELYFEYHRGVYTTQAKTKWRHRRNEELLLNAEKFDSLASLYGVPYTQEEFQSAWRKLLFNQFHDILPGSGIAVVYRDAARDHAEVRRAASAILDQSLRAIASRIDTRGPGVPVVVFNPLSWTRTDVVEAEVELPSVAGQIAVRDLAGRNVPAEVLRIDAGARTAHVRFVAADVPSLGYKIFRVVTAPAPATPQPPHKSAAKFSIENEFLRVAVDPRTGCITSILEKRLKREALAPGACGNLLQAFRDKPKDWDAWNIDSNFEDEKWDLTEAAVVHPAKASEPVPSMRSTIRVERKFRNSSFVQEISLTRGISRVEIWMQADWHEDHTLLKVAFPLAVSADRATFEIPYGSIERPTTRNTSIEKAQFEVPALRWADLSDASFGVSLLNDSKYGYDAKGNVLRLTLLRSPKWPDPDADRGRHEFSYAIYPHAGSWKDAAVMRRGYEFNYKLLAVQARSHPGSLPPRHSFLEFSADNVLLTALKRAEDDDALIARFFEWKGAAADFRLRVPPDFASATLTDLMETSPRPADLRNGQVRLSIRPFTIESLKLSFRSTAP